MASSPDSVSMALFCDFENVALGVRDAKYEKFDIKPVLERLLLKGSIVVKKAYCDWERYKGFKATMHEANFELIEIPHVRQSGKNSADIRLVVDALDLCYTKSHVNTFVIISGDSDFSPLVSKLRENAKQVIGVGVKQSTSDLLIANCDEFIFYDDLVRETQRSAHKRDSREAVSNTQKRSTEDEKRRKDELDARRSKAIEIAVQTFDALVAERGDSGKIWASMLKEAIKRRKPDFNESYFGFRAFGNLLEEAKARGLLDFGRDEKSGAFVFRSVPVEPSMPDLLAASEAAAPATEVVAEESTTTGQGAAKPEAQKQESRRRGRGGRAKSPSAPGGESEPIMASGPDSGPANADQAPPETVAAEAPPKPVERVAQAMAEESAAPVPKSRSPRRSRAKAQTAEAAEAAEIAPSVAGAPPVQPDESDAAAKPVRRRRSAKPKTDGEGRGA